VEEKSIRGFISEHESKTKVEMVKTLIQNAAVCDETMVVSSTNPLHSTLLLPERGDY
jgi:hypothetical protein